jgi:hypothetical protein
MQTPANEPPLGQIILIDTHSNGERHRISVPMVRDQFGRWGFPQTVEYEGYRYRIVGAGPDPDGSLVPYYQTSVKL